MHADTHLLLIEDDAEISSMVSRFMGNYGYRVSVAEDGRSFDGMMAGGRVDLVLLDLMLPGENGLSLCRRIRAASKVPIIMLTALGSEADRVVGLEVGADDYLTKPFSSRELLARVRAVLRRSAWLDSRIHRHSTLTFDGWALDLGLRKLRSPDGLHVSLTTTEFNILSVFCQHAGKVLSREQILDQAYGRVPASLGRSIDLQISRLRRKIEADPKNPTMIITVRQGGYIFTSPVQLL
ncbi:MAG TPA: response regulator [Rhodopila sp.]|uniref:response regulator n=1 Tax=Rhodopila sp. TaxID=2480087 RepID=UPI002B5E46BB|nr:response regulator [Rhodopila sp.]HVY17221.1 response regulator [Rhodopila sp.]